MVKLQLYSIILALVASVAVSSSNDQSLRRTAEQSHRRLPHPPHHHSSSGSGGTSDYYGCLDLNTTEQAQVWPDGPGCDYGSGSGSGSGGNGTATGGGDSSGNGDDTVTQYEVVDDDTTSNPYEDFVITQCDTYESLWRWDLHMSCGGDSSNLDSCNCTFAEELFDKGLLVCEDRDQCPRNCPICSTCLSVLGCPETAGPIDRLATSTMIYIIVGAVILLVVALAVFHSRRRRQQQHELKQHLITEDECDADDGGAGNAGRFEPPNADAGTSPGAGAVMVAGGAAAGPWKASKETDSEADTDDCTRSIDATLPTVEDSSAMPFVAMAAAGIATVRSEEEDAGPEDENEETENVDTSPNGNTESANEDDSATMETTSSPSTSGEVGAVREAFLQSLEEDGNVKDQQEKISSPAALGEDDVESQPPTNGSINSHDQEGEPQPSTNEIGADSSDGNKTSDISPEESSDETSS
ncbi:unnamed protein product [Cylindrotheca closterium]|uniref:ShKT domain-containing protein n=1 Tax=Cylindrotheca closterium TaxID=2856 RepID=A0AAD2GBW0_9STRA|nr:unnamed protein product [Cylindrotheca closterium]